MQSQQHGERDAQGKEGTWQSQRQEITYFCPEIAADAAMDSSQAGQDFEESLSYIIAALVVEGFQSLSLNIKASQFEWERDREGGSLFS